MEMKALIDRARSLAKEKDCKEAWSKLREWASSESHPFAMKAAVFQFLEAHGTNPSAISILPEVLHSAASLPLEKGDRQNLIRLTDRAFESATKLTAAPKKPAPAFLITPLEQQRKSIYAPLTFSRDINHLIGARDAILHVNDSIKTVKLQWKK